MNRAANISGYVLTEARDTIAVKTYGKCRGKGVLLTHSDPVPVKYKNYFFPFLSRTCNFLFSHSELDIVVN